MAKKLAQVAEPEVTPRYCGSRLEFLLSLYLIITVNNSHSTLSVIDKVL